MVTRGSRPTAHHNLTRTAQHQDQDLVTRHLQDFRLLAWNVRTLIDRPSTTRPERRTALVGLELARFNIDVAALSETRLPDEGQRSEASSGYTFFWKGKPASERRIHGVGFAVKTSLVREHHLLPEHVNERISTLRMPLLHGFVTIISVYAPTLTSDDDMKESFYASLRSTLSSVHPQDKLLLLGDLNARVGKDHELWKEIIGRHGVGNCNSNGILLLGLCAEFNLIITNTTFRLRTRDKTSWMHPRSRHWHLIDYAITRQEHQAMVMVTKALRGADDCWTDHRPIFCSLRIRLKPKQRSHTNNPPRKRFNITALKDSSSASMYRSALSARLQRIDHKVDDPEDAWTSLKAAIISAATESIGFVNRRHQDWFDDNSHAIRDLIEQKRKARLAWQHNPKSKSKENDFRTIKATVQRTIRKIQNDWWNAKAEEIQGYADRSESRNFFQAVRETYGPRSNATHPLRASQDNTLLKDEEAILDRWKEHFEQLLNRPSQATEDLVRNLPQNSVQEWMDEPPTANEVVTAIRAMRTNKASGSDGVPAELLQEGEAHLLNHIHRLFLCIWSTRIIPHELKDANIVTIFKKGDRSECGNYRGISLLSTTGKVFARVLLNRLQQLSETILPESQYGFRPNRGTAEMIFCARQLLEKAREQQRSMMMVFFDLQKAFDSVPRDALWRVLTKFGCPPVFVQLIQGLHDDMKGSVVHCTSLSPPFPISTGVKQGCILAPTLFTLYLTAVHFHAHASPHHLGVDIRFRTDGGLFNLRRLKSKTKTQHSTISELQYADDNCVPGSSMKDLQQSTNAFVETYESAGLEVNVGKTKILIQSHPTCLPNDQVITIHDVAVEKVPRFCYLGSMLNDSNDPQDDVQNRLRLSHQAFGKLNHRVFSQHGLTTQTKINVYRAIVIPTLLYGSESMTLYRKHFRELERFHQQKLRQILAIKWDDRVTNNSVLHRANLPSLEALIVKSQLRFLGHIQRREDSNLPKQVLYGELATGSRPTGAPKKRFKDQLHHLLKKSRLPVNAWETLTEDRPTWRRETYNGAARYEEARAEEMEQRRRRRHQRLLQPPPPTLPCPLCPRLLATRIGLYSHMAAHQRRRRR